jgi:hypothetical protein
MTEVLEMTLRPLMPDAVEMISSVIPSAKNSSFGSGDTVQIRFEQLI